LECPFEVQGVHLRSVCPSLQSDGCWSLQSTDDI
jgi:hypothetical protein